MLKKDKPTPLEFITSYKWLFWLIGAVIGLGLLAFLPLNQPSLIFSLSPDQLAIRDGTIINDGFYNPELDPQKNKYIWTNGNPSISFDAQSLKPLQVTLELRSATVAGGKNAPIRVVVNGVEVTQLNLDPSRSDFQTINFKTPAREARIFKLELQTTAFVLPGDSRSLGFMVKSISIDRSEAWSPIAERLWLYWASAVLLLLVVSLFWVSIRTHKIFVGLAGAAGSLGGLVLMGLALYLLFVEGPIDSAVYPYWIITTAYVGLYFALALVNIPIGQASLNRRLAIRLTSTGHVKSSPFVWWQKFNEFISSKRGLPFLIILVGLYRVALVSKGRYAWGDEFRYPSSLTAIERLLDLDFVGFCNAISSTQARPGDATVHLVPAFFQVILYRITGAPYASFASSLIPALTNVLVTLLVLALFYKLTLFLFEGQHKTAFFGSLVYALLSNNNLYFRHLFPYDIALLAFLFPLYYTLKMLKTGQPQPLRKYIVIGGWMGAGYTIYPGYYYLPVFIFLLLLIKDPGKLFSWAKALRLGTYLFCAGLVLVLYEVIARIGNTSYLDTSQSLSGTINLGSYDEGYIYLPKYLFLVENFIGIGLFICLVAYIVSLPQQLIKRGFSGNEGLLALLFLLFAFGYLIHASLSAVVHLMVFYGRLLHIYYPVLVWVSLAVIQRIKSEYYRKLSVGGILASSLLSFSLFFVSYNNLAYPNDAVYQVAKFYCQSTPNYPPLAAFPEQLEQASYIIAIDNCVYFPPSPIYLPYEVPANARLLYKAPHFKTFPAYGFEDFNIQEREYMIVRNPQITFYEIKK